MASYTIMTSRKQQVGLQFAYDTYADKTQYPTIQEYFQYRINTSVLDPMYVDEQAAQSISFDNSFNTIPETSQPKAKTDIQAVILANGGTIVPAGSAPNPPLPPSVVGRVIPPPGGEVSNPIQAGTADKESS